MFRIGLKDRLPNVRGSYRENEPLAPLTWFRVGGPAEVLFKPKDADDLATFIRHKPADVPVTVIGVGSNLLIRDGGVPGVVIRLPAAFGHISVDLDRQQITAGAFSLDARVAQEAAKAGIGGLGFLAGIPGSIGGALRMNAGAHGGEIKDLLVEGVAIDPNGNITTLRADAFGHQYRHCALDPDWIFLSATLQGTPSDPETEKAAIQAVQDQREATQPIKTRTGGSTFKNPPNGSAWKAIDAAGLRGHNIGGAQVSEMHCNFLLNNGSATAKDIESLGEYIRRRVYETQGCLLQWEIKRLGLPQDGEPVDLFSP